MTTEKQPKQIKVEVLKGQVHRHKGRDYKEGAKLTLTHDQSQWLVGEKKVKEIK